MDKREELAELKKLKELYFNEDVCMGNILATTKCSDVGDLTLEQAHDLYEQALDWSGDEVISELVDKKGVM